MKPNKIAESVGNLFTKGGVTPSEPTNTHVELASQAAPEPEQRPDHGERDGDGSLPKLAALSNDRSRVLKDIAARRNAQAVTEGNEDMPATDEDGNEQESNAAAPEPEGADLDAGGQEQTPDAGATTVAAQTAPAAPAPEETREIIVDGQRHQVPLSKIVEMGTRTLQKEVAADVRLNQASQLLAEAKRIAEGQQPPQGAAQPQAMGALDDDQLAELIQYGTKEQAAQAIKALRSSAPQVRPEDIARYAQQAVAPQMAFEAGKNFVQSEYGDLLGDEDLRAIFLNKENALRKSGDQRGYVELYKAIGDEIRTKFNRPKAGVRLPAAPAPTSTGNRSMAEKQAAKAQAPAAPRLASARLDGDGGQPKPPTRGEVIDKMRKARAFQPYASQK